jgi:hypothetical protein
MSEQKNYDIERAKFEGVGSYKLPIDKELMKS